MLSDYVLELWSVTAEQRPSRGWSVTALRTQQHHPDLCSLRQSSAPFLERASSGDPQGDVLAGHSWGVLCVALGRGIQPGIPPMGARSGRILLSAALGHTRLRASGPVGWLLAQRYLRSA